MYGYCSKCVNMDTFRSTDVEHFWGNLCKICVFLYYAKVYICWCRCSNGKIFGIRLLNIIFLNPGKKWKLYALSTNVMTNILKSSNTRWWILNRIIALYNVSNKCPKSFWKLWWLPHFLLLLQHHNSKASYFSPACPYTLSPLNPFFLRVTCIIF